MFHDTNWTLVAEVGPEGYATRITTSSHSVFADEPVELGGQDTGPNPYDFLLAALGSCATITMRMYADRKGWPLEFATVKLRHSRVHAKDCEECESEEGFVALIEKEVALEGDLDDAQRARLLEIADRCPVHKTVSGEVRFETTLAP